MKKLSTILCTLALLIIGVGSATSVKAAKTNWSPASPWSGYANCKWTAATNTFSWNGTHTVVRAIETGFSGDLSAYKTFYATVSNLSGTGVDHLSIKANCTGGSEVIIDLTSGVNAISLADMFANPAEVTTFELWGPSSTDVDCSAVLTDVYLTTGAVDENVNITIDSETRNYQLYIPANAEDNCPLVLSLHGANGHSADYSPFRTSVSDAEGCIVAYPQGKQTTFPIGMGGNSTTGWTATGDDNFDVEFIKAVIENVASKHSIDRKRIYCCGFSNGGMMTYAMANACSDEIAAFASISGYPINEFHLHHTGSRPVPFLHIHGKADDFVLYEKMPTIVDEMVARMGANPVPTTTTGNGYTKNVYTASDGSFPYVYYEIDGMGHVDYTDKTEDGSSAKTMWNFFKNYTLDSQSDETLKWAPRIEEEGFTPAEHGWTVNSGTTLLQFGGDQYTESNKNVYHSLQFDNGNYKLCFKSTGTAGKTIGVKIEKLTGSKVVLSTTVNVGEDTELPIEVTDGWGEYKLTMTRLSESDNITVSDITIKQTEDTPSKYIQLGNVLTLNEAVTASTNGTGVAIVYNDSKLFTNKNSGDPKMFLEDISNVNRGYLYKLTARASVDDVQYYRLECFNPDNTLITAGTDAGAYGDNILSPVSWGDIWASANVSKNATESGDGNAYTAEEWDGRDYKYAAQWCFESDGNGGYYIKTRAVGSQNPYISGSGGMTNESGKASFKFYSLSTKSFATLNFNSSGVAHINLSDLQLSSGLTYDPATGILTSATGNEDLYLLFDNEDFSGVTRIDVARTTTGTENEIEYSDIINTLDIYDATSNNTLHTWYSSKYGVSDIQNYSPDRVNKIRWHITHAGTMKLTGITITGKVVNGIAPHWVDITKDMYNGDCELNLNKDEGTCVYGKMWNFTADTYADISNFQKLKLTGAANTSVRIWINNSSQADTRTIGADGSLTIDFSTEAKYKDEPYLHLCNIRPSYGSTANISSIQLYNPHYAVIGSGRILTSAQSILDNEEVTSINATGINAATELVTANPNCLITANDGMVTNSQNVIVNGTCASLVLTDGYPFKAPSDFTATAATYTTTISTAAQAGTLCLPYAAAIPEGVTAYTLTYQSGDNATATEVETTIPANTPVLLNGSGEVTFTGSGAVSASATNVSGALKGVFETGTVPEGSYVLQKKDNKLGFFKVGSTPINIKPFRAYLTAQAGARLGITFADETTGIETSDNLTISPVDHPVYNLKGQRVTKPTKGLYIKNGKKVVIK